MLNFRFTNIAFGLLMVNAIVLSFFINVPWWYFLLLVLCYLLMLFYGSYFVGASFFMTIICKANTKEKIIALSFDDGPTIFTKEVLSILKDHNVKATFFCIGKNIEQNKETLQLIHEAGHIVGNHSYSHTVAFDFWSSKKVVQDLGKTEELIQGIIDQKVNWFRPPYGVTTPNIAKAVKQLNYKAIGWSIRSFDTMANDTNKLFASVSAQLHPGAIILFHDSQKVTVEMLPRFIEYVKERGFEIVAMDKLLNLNAYASR